MPKATICTHGTLNFNANGVLQSVKVQKIFSEDNIVKNQSKEVSIFDKYTSKKSLNQKCKRAETSLER